MKKDAQAVVLLLIGGTLLKISFAGTYLRYVKPGLLPLLVGAGVVVIAVACVTLWQVIRAPAQTAAAEPERPAASGGGAMWPEAFSADAPARSRPARVSTVSGALDVDRSTVSGVHGADRSTVSGVHGADRSTVSGVHGADRSTVSGVAGVPGADVSMVASSSAVGGSTVSSSAALSALPDGGAAPGSALDGSLVPAVAAGDAHGQSRIGWLLLAPALALLLFAPPALGSYQASRNGTALGSRTTSDFPPLSSGDPLRLTLLDYAGRAVFDQGRTLRGRQLRLTGFVISGPGGRPYLARMIVSCCAADARPVKVGLVGNLPSNLKADQWIEVDGSYTERADRDPVNAEIVPYLQVAAVTPIPPPTQPYES